MEKFPKVCLKLKERLGIFSLAVFFSLVLAAISFVFTDAFSDIFLFFLKKEEKADVIWVENMVETVAPVEKGNSTGNRETR